MTIYFSEEECEWMVREWKNVRIKEGCPQAIAEAIQKKLDSIKRIEEIRRIQRAKYDTMGESE